MKKILFLILPVVLVACNGFVKTNENAENIKQLYSEPKNCEFLYKQESTIAVYDSEDAHRYVKNAIADNDRGGNSFLVTQEKTKSNPSAILGPKNTFIINVSVYDCPEK